ncbi:MAG: hypothetical protein ACTFAK_16025 [Candidatus Electronema sp. VV]
MPSPGTLSSSVRCFSKLAAPTVFRVDVLDGLLKEGDVLLSRSGLGRRRHGACSSHAPQRVTRRMTRDWSFAGTGDEAGIFLGWWLKSADQALSEYRPFSK